LSRRARLWEGWWSQATTLQAGRVAGTTPEPAAPGLDGRPAAFCVLAVAVSVPVPEAVDVEILYSASDSTSVTYPQAIEKTAFIAMWHKNCFIYGERH
jgi:hypothetical protein